MNAALFAYSRRGCATARRVMAALADWDIQPYTMERFAEEGFRAARPSGEGVLRADLRGRAGHDLCFERRARRAGGRAAS